MSHVRVPPLGRDGHRRYGANERPENPARCRAEVVLGNVSHQCRRARLHGREHAYCRQHAEMLRRAGGRQ